MVERRQNLIGLSTVGAAAGADRRDRGRFGSVLRSISGSGKDTFSSAKVASGIKIGDDGVGGASGFHEMVVKDVRTMAVKEVRKLASKLESWWCRHCIESVGG